eukprot:s2658_g12.t1
MYALYFWVFLLLPSFVRVWLVFTWSLAPLRATEHEPAVLACAGTCGSLRPMGAKLASSCCTAAEPEEVVLAPEYHTDFLGKPLFYNEDSLLDHTVDINNAKPQAKWQGQKEVKKDHSNFDYPAFCCKAKGPGVLAEEADDEVSPSRPPWRPSAMPKAKAAKKGKKGSKKAPKAKAAPAEVERESSAEEEQVAEQDRTGRGPPPYGIHGNACGLMSKSKILEPRRRAAGEQFEPRRPNDPRWSAQHGDLRSDLGPIFPLVNLSYPEGLAAVQCQEDGSGVASYPSGKKAVCVSSHHQSRRFSALAYARSVFSVKTAVSETSPHFRSASPEDPKRDRGRTRLLGAIDEWGIGLFESPPDGTGCRGSYEVTPTHVIVITSGPNGSKTRMSRAALAGDTTSLDPLSLRLCPELVVTYNPASGTTSLDFNSGGVSYTFHVGEVWKLSSRGSGLPTATNPLEINGTINLSSQASLDTSCVIMTESASLLDKTLKNSTSCLSTTATSLHETSAPAAKLKKSASEGTMRLPLEAFKQFAEGRIDFTHDHLLKQNLANKVHPKLGRLPINKALKEGFLWPQPHPGKPYSEPVVLNPPASLQYIQCHEVESRAGSLEGGQLMVVLVVASWARKSQYSSSSHAQVMAEGAWSELKAAGDNVLFFLTDLAEAGAIHSAGKHTNPLVTNYGVREAPWLLMFARGELVFSENPTGPRNGGIGFASRLRYMAFSKPRVLVLEPAPSASSMQSAAATAVAESTKAINNFQLQLQTQEVLKRAHFDFDLAVTTVDAMRMALTVQPAYGILLCSSEVGPTAFSELASRLRERNPKSLGFICHDMKCLGPLDDSMQMLLKPRRTKANRLKEALEEEEEEEKEPKGVVYLGHIPNGFFEPQMRKYFSQFGQVTRMRLARSRKTGGSKGYAFIEFKEESVAKIVASTMNKIPPRYLLFDKSLVCEFLPKEKVDTRTYLQSSLAFCACHRNFLETLLAVSQEALRRLAKNTEGQVKLVHSFLLNSPGVEHAYVHSSLWVFGSSLLLQDTRKERREKEVIQDNDRPMVEVNGVSVPQLTEQQASRQQRQKRKLKDSTFLEGTLCSAPLSLRVWGSQEKLASLEVDFDLDEVLGGRLHRGIAKWGRGPSLSPSPDDQLESAEGAAGERLQRGKHLQQDWNSREFLRELNRQARSLSMEFKPFQHSFR